MGKRLSYLGGLGRELVVGVDFWLVFFIFIFWGERWVW